MVECYLLRLFYQSMTKLIPLIVLLTLLSGCASIGGQKKVSTNQQVNVLKPSNLASSAVAAELLHRDVDQLVTLVEQVHPEPYSLISKQQLLNKANEIKQSINYPLKRREFYLKLAPLITALSDVHSTLNLPQKLNQTFAEKALSSGLFPLAVLYEDYGLFVATDLSGRPQVPIGAKLVAINHLPIEYLVSAMKRITSYETETGLRRRIQVDFAWLLADLGLATERYHVKYEYESVTYQVDLAGLSIESTDDYMAESSTTKNQDANIEEQPKAKASFYGSSLLTGGTGLIWFNDFNEDPETFDTYLDSQFERFALQGVSNLVIDVRYNDGGLSQNIKNLLSRLTKEPLEWYKSGEIKVSESLKLKHQEATRERRKKKYEWGLQWLPLEWTDALQYKILWGDIGESIDIGFSSISASEHLHFKQVVVLTNGYCYSACSAFVAAVNQHELAYTLGETAGSIAQVQYAYPIELVLSHSQLALSLPTIKLSFDSSLYNRNEQMMKEQSLIQPQKGIRRTIEGVKKRQDSSLRAALNYLEKHTDGN